MYLGCAWVRPKNFMRNRAPRAKHLISILYAPLIALELFERFRAHGDMRKTKTDDLLMFVLFYNCFETVLVKTNVQRILMWRFSGFCLKPNRRFSKWCLHRIDAFQISFAVVYGCASERICWMERNDRNKQNNGATSIVIINETNRRQQKDEMKQTKQTHNNWTKQKIALRANTCIQLHIRM